MQCFEIFQGGQMPQIPTPLVAGLAGHVVYIAEEQI